MKDNTIFRETARPRLDARQNMVRPGMFQSYAECAWFMLWTLLIGLVLGALIVGAMEVWQ